MNLYQPTITGSLSVSGSVNISGSITIAGGGTISGTASIATTALTASFVANAQTASYVLNAVSSSFALTASSADNLLVRNTLTAQTLVVQTITSSVDFVTGSTRFGSISANTHVFTGSVSITGSALNVNNGGLFVSSSNNVGINTTNPTSPLTVKAGSRSDTLRLTISGSSSVSDAVGITFGSANYDKAQIIAYNENVGNASGYLTFWTGGSPATTDMTERIRITSAGNVGIGTTSPSEKLHLYNNTAATSTTLIIENNVNNYNCQINFKSIYGGSTAKSFLIGSNISVAAGSWEVYDATAAAARLVISNTGVLTHNSSGVSTIVLGASANYTNISSGGYGATLYMNGATRGGTTTGANGAVVLATDAAFYVTDSSTNTSKFTVQSNGQSNFKHNTANLDVITLENQNASPFGINITYTGATPNNTTNNFLYFADSGGNRFKTTSNGNCYNSNNVYTALSDIKLKENITDTTPKLDKLMQVRIVNFNLKKDPSLKQIGVIAQELQEVFPGLVEENYDIDTDNKVNGETTLGVKYSVFVPILIKAIQEQQTLITTLQEKLERNNII